MSSEGPSGRPLVFENGNKRDRNLCHSVLSFPLNPPPLPLRVLCQALRASRSSYFRTQDATGKLEIWPAFLRPSRGKDRNDVEAELVFQPA